MKNFLDLLNELVKMNMDNEILDDFENLDLSKDEDYEKVVQLIDEIQNDNLVRLVGSVFGLNDEDFTILLDAIKEQHKLLKEKEVNKNQEQKLLPSSVQTKVKDNSISEIKVERPSQKINTQAGLQIHKLVQEYVDTMIKPYNPEIGGLSTQQINDAYAGIYEYSCWLYNHK